MGKYHFDLEIGKDYKVKKLRSDNEKGRPPTIEKGAYKATFVEINNRIAIFDTGNYKTSEMIKDYRIGRRAS